MAKLVNIILMSLWSSTAQCSCSFFWWSVAEICADFCASSNTRLVWLLWWLVGTKHFPESKTLPRIQKHFPESKNTSKNPKHVPKTKNTSKNPKICKNIWRMLLGVATTKCSLLLSWLLFFKITLSSRKYSYLPALKTFTLRKTNWS